MYVAVASANRHARGGHSYLSAPADRLPYSGELWRKAIHLIALAIPALMVLAGKTRAVAFLFALASIAVAADLLRARSVRFAKCMRRIFGFVMRPSEWAGPGGAVVINGATWVMVAALLLTVVFPVRIAAAALAVCMMGDAAAAVVGRRFGRHRWPGSRRSVEGSLAFLATGAVTMALLPSFSFWVGLASVTAAAAAEIPDGPMNDNVRVPFTAAAVLFALERFTLGMDAALLRFP